MFKYRNDSNITFTTFFTDLYSDHSQHAFTSNQLQNDFPGFLVRSRDQWTPICVWGCETVIRGHESIEV